MSTKELIEKINCLASPAAENAGCELIDLEYLNECGRWVLRLYIDKKENPVSVADCEKVSRAVAALLDVENIMPGRYNLEVSSPGSPRPVRKPADFERYAGSKISIKTYNKVGDRKNFKGTLKGMKNDLVLVDVAGALFEVPQSEISRARLFDEAAIGGKKNG